MTKYKLFTLEKFVLVNVFIMLALGYLLFFTTPLAFVRYVAEDGPVEWWTVLGLLLGFFVCMERFIRLFKKRNWWFLTVTLLLGLMLFFAAGEEISWGQRILGLKSSEFFDKNNAQSEINFHNLIVGGVKINKLVFSLLLGIAMGIYLIVIPLVHQANSKVHDILNTSGIPVARIYQVISFLLLIIATTLLRHEKNAELLECGTALLFFLIIRYPKNIQVFRDGQLA